MKINLIKSIIIVIITILSFSCNSPNSPNVIEYKNNVLFNLIVNEKDQKLYIYNTYDYSERVTDSFYVELKDLFVKNADIKLKTSSSIFNNFIIKESPTFLNYSKGFFYSNNQELLLAPNTQYFLEININNDVVYGTTTTPGDFTILEPKDDLIIQQNTNRKDLIIKWSNSKNAYGYICQIFTEGRIIFPDSSFYDFKNDYTKYSKDTVLILHNLVIDSTEINIIAFDENYHNHIFGEITSVGLEGAYGYFGSSIKKTRKISIVSQ